MVHPSRTLPNKAIASAPPSCVSLSPPSCVLQHMLHWATTMEPPSAQATKQSQLSQQLVSCLSKTWAPNYCWCWEVRRSLCEIKQGDGASVLSSLAGRWPAHLGPSGGSRWQERNLGMWHHRSDGSEHINMGTVGFHFLQQLGALQSEFQCIWSTVGYRIHLIFVLTKKQKTLLREHNYTPHLV